MKDERDPVSPDEHVWRMIPNVAEMYDPSLPMPIRRDAFQPRKNDTHGLSVYRCACGASPAEIADSLPKRGDYYAARLRVRAIGEFGLTVVSDPQEGPPGHAIIPELSYGEYRSDKRKSKAIQVELAKMAGKAIVFTPAPRKRP